MILGTVSSVDSISGIRVTVDGEGSASTKKYSYLASYVPAANDRVLIEEINGRTIIRLQDECDTASSQQGC